MKITNIRSVPITKLAISPFNVRQEIGRAHV